MVKNAGKESFLDVCGGDTDVQKFGVTGLFMGSSFKSFDRECRGMV